MNQKIQQAMMSYIRLFLHDDEDISVEDLGNGNIFSRMLIHAEGFRFLFGEFQENPINWIQKLSNLKLIVKKVSAYFESKLGKGIKTDDINLIQLAKNNKKTEILKLFEVVLAILTQCPNKQEHINKIMSLDQKKQSDFVWLIQKILQSRIIDLQKYQNDRQFIIIHELEFQNTMLQKQIQSIIQKKYFLEEQIAELKKQRQIQSEDSYLKFNNKPNDQNYHLIVHNQQLKNMVENLKNKLLSTTRQHQLQAYKLNQQIQILNSQISKLQYAEQNLEIYKQKYEQFQIVKKSNRKWQKQHIKLNRLIAQKQTTNKKLQQRIDIAIQQNYQWQQKQVYLMMEIQKKQVQFKQLQKQVKKQIKFNYSLYPDSSQTFTISQTNLSHQPLSHLLTSTSIQTNQALENKDLKQNMDKLKKKNKETERQNNRLQRKLERINNLEKEKKRLQKMVVDAHQARTQQISLLLTVLAEISIQNTRYYKLLKQNKLLEESK